MPPFFHSEQLISWQYAIQADRIQTEPKNFYLKSISVILKHILHFCLTSIILPILTLLGISSELLTDGSGQHKKTCAKVPNRKPATVEELAVEQWLSYILLHFSIKPQIQKKCSTSVSHWIGQYRGLQCTRPSVYFITRETHETSSKASLLTTHCTSGAPQVMDTQVPKQISLFMIYQEQRTVK